MLGGAAVQLLQALKCYRAVARIENRGGALPPLPRGLLPGEVAAKRQRGGSRALPTPLPLSVPQLSDERAQVVVSDLILCFLFRSP